MHTMRSLVIVYLYVLSWQWTELLPFRRAIIKLSSRSCIAWTECASRPGLEEVSSRGDTSRGCYVTWGSTRYVPLLALSDIWIAINSPWHTHNDNINLNHVPPGGPGPASNTLWCQRRREDERVNEAGASVSPELLSREPEQPGQWPPPAQLYWRLFMFTSMILSCYPGLGAASQTFRAFHEPRPARGEDHVCNISGQFAKKIK